MLLRNNQLTGTIPTELGALASLELLWLFNNNLSGSMPQDVCNLRTTNGGLLFLLQADCKSEVVCSCCTRCFKKKSHQPVAICHINENNTLILTTLKQAECVS